LWQISAQRRHTPLPNVWTHKALLLVLVSLWLVPASAHGQDQDNAQKKLQQLEAEIQAQKTKQANLEASSQAALSEADRLSLDLVALARDIRISEGNATRLERRIALLEAEETKKDAALEDRRDELLELLSALERLSKRPAGLALLQPSEALTTARIASLMGTIVPDINAKAGTLREELASLAAIQQNLSNERYSLKNTLERLTDNQLKIGSLVRKRQLEARKASSDARQIAREVQKFAAEAANLKELIEKLAEAAAKKAQSAAQIARPDRSRPDRSRPDRKKPALGFTSRPMADLKGSLPFPVMGRVIHKFGAKEDVGNARGIKIETRPDAQVVAPYDGKIVFAGPFREYGQLLIIEHGGGYHSLMAGFGELYGSVGQRVLTGEPVGAMAPVKRLAPLYLEMRQSGRAINPEPWLNRQLVSSR